MTITHKKQFITEYNYRFINERYHDLNEINWVFLPGGLGFGSEYLNSLISRLDINANIWRLDFPEDGSNRFNYNIDFDKTWKLGLINALGQFNNTVLVTHSVSSMLALSIPEIDNLLHALVIISSAPSYKWSEEIVERAKPNALPKIEYLNSIYASNKNDSTYKQFFLNLLPYYVKSSYLNQAMILFRNLPYHYERYEWCQEYFHENKYIGVSPKRTKTLILGSSDDIITPLSLFYEEQTFLRENICFAELNNAGHFPWIEKPEECIRLIKDFASSIGCTY